MQERKSMKEKKNIIEQKQEIILGYADKYICEKAEISRSLCKDCFEKGLITVGGKTVKQSYQIKENDVIVLEEFELEEYDESDENKEMHNLYKIEKENYFLVNNQEDKSVYNFKDYCEYYKDMCIFDKGLIAYYDQIYNLDTDTFIYELEDEQLIEKIEYRQSFIIVKFILFS